MKNKYSFKAIEIISKFCLSEFLKNFHFFKKNHFFEEQNLSKDFIYGVDRHHGYILYFEGDSGTVY